MIHKEDNERYALPMRVPRMGASGESDRLVRCSESNVEPAENGVYVWREIKSAHASMSLRRQLTVLPCALQRERRSECQLLLLDREQVNCLGCRVSLRTV